MCATTENCAVKIAVRERPARVPYHDEDSVIRYIEDVENVIYVDNRPFVFDYILNQTVNQAELFDELIRPLVEKVKDGFNCTALAYGQTGTGKSYSMGLSCEKFEDENAGIVTRCLREFLKTEEKENHNETNLLENPLDTTAESQKLTLSVSYIEIYNEKLYDLLADNYTEPIVSRGYKFTGGQRRILTNLEDCHRILLQGAKNRHVRPTVMNTKSSRSHAIFTIHVRNRSNAEHPTTACLNLVDLAGSEGIRRTGHQGMAMSEGVTINKGLLSIGKVLHALSTGLKVIPYRDSVLSSVLQDSLNPNSFLTMIACISPHRADLSETLSTLRFAQSAKQLKNSPYVNVVYSAKKKSMGRPSYKPNVSNIRKSLNGLKHSGAIRKSKSATNRFTVNKNHNTVNGPLDRTVAKKLLLEQTQEEDTQNTTTIDISGNTLHQSSVSSLERTFDLNYKSFICPATLNQLLTSTNQKPKATVDTNENLPGNHAVMSVLSNLQSLLKNMMNKENPINQIAPPPPTIDAINEDFENNLKKMLYEALKPSFCREEPSALAAAPTEPVLDSNFKKLFVPKLKSPLASMSADFEPTDASIVSSTLAQEVTCSTPTINSRRFTRSSLKATELSAANRSKSKRTIKANELPALAEDVETKVAVVKSERKTTKKKHVKHNTLKSILESETKNSKFSLTNHRKAVLDIFNNGTLSDLKSLPRIGEKTAYQIILHRSANGKFKNLKQLETLPVWHTKAMWAKFATANLLN